MELFQFKDLLMTCFVHLFIFRYNVKKIIVAYVNQAQIHSWNLPVQRNGCKVSCPTKERAFGGARTHD